MTTPDLPERFDGPSAWSGTEMAGDPSRWSRLLSAVDVAGLERAATRWRRAAGDGVASGPPDLGDLRKEDFPLDGFEHRVRAMERQLLHGVGVQLLRGLRGLRGLRVRRVRRVRRFLQRPPSSGRKVALS